LKVGFNNLNFISNTSILGINRKMDSNTFLRIVIILLFVLPIIHACNQGCHFEQAKWLEKKDLSYPYRDVMLDDLVKNYELTGLTYQQLTDLLGQPDSLSDRSNEVVYEIKVEYDIDVDPVYVKNLIFEFSPDSTVLGFKIEEYRRAALEDDDPIDLTMTLKFWYKFRSRVDITIAERLARLALNFIRPIKSVMKT